MNQSRKTEVYGVSQIALKTSFSDDTQQAYTAVHVTMTKLEYEL